MHADPLMHAEQHEREMAKAERRTAWDIECAAERVRRSLQPLDIFSQLVRADHGDQLMQSIHAGKFDEVGREWAQRLRDCLKNVLAECVKSDAVEVAEGSKLLGLIREGKIDEAGQLWADQLADYCARCARIEVGVEPAQRVPAFDRLVGRDEWAGHMDRMSAIAMSKEGAR